MNTYKLTPKERFDLVMECRSSGLSDQQWCLEHGISRTTLSDEELTFKQLNQVAPIMDSFTTTFAPVAEICCNDVIIRISNEISSATA